MTAQENQLQQMIVTLRTRILVMAAMVGLALDDAYKALQEGDVGRASAVIDGDYTINELENEIDAKALSLLARTQPVAGDLRFVVSALRMVVDLERIGDEAASMSERTIIMQDLNAQPLMADITELMEICRRSYSSAIEAFREGDLQKALEVRNHEDDASLMEVRIMQKLVQDMGKSVEPQLSMHIILITRALNRVWRRAVNIAEHTYFIYSGVSLKHKHVDEKP